MRLVATLFVLAGAGCASVRPTRPAAVVAMTFAGDHLDTTVWRIVERPGNHQGTPDAESQRYTRQAVTVRDGAVHLTARPAAAGEALPFTSGRIETRQAARYGRVEVRARLPRGRGLWPALWLRTPTDRPLNGEIDIVEGYGSHPNVAQSTVHDWVDGRDTGQWCAWLIVQPLPDSPRFHGDFCTRLTGRVTMAGDLADAFHTYAIDWSPEAIIWSLDGVPYFQVHEHVPRNPMIIVLDLATGGGWDGTPDSADLPRSLDVEWVRWTDPDHAPIFGR
jgi:beta-glucanase (GH16 family)